MNILLTGDNGFVGRHAAQALKQAGYQVKGLEAEPTFWDWKEKVEKINFHGIRGVVHAGALTFNQCELPDIFLWNAYASHILAKQVKETGGSMPFIFFSSFQVNVVEQTPEKASWYGWSKKYAEDNILEIFPLATILRPSVMWGDESHKKGSGASVPFQLATHQLKYLYEEWGRDYVHVNDVTRAICTALVDKPSGIFNLNGEYWWNKDLRRLTGWDDYDVIDTEDKPQTFDADIRPMDLVGLQQLPNWKYSSSLEEEFKKLEAKFIYAKDS